MTVCPECGAALVRGPRSGRKVFCSPAHQRAFHHLMAHRGQLVMPFDLAVRRAKHGQDAALARWARATRDTILDAFNAEDRAAGRQPHLVVAAKQEARWNPADVNMRRAKPRRTRL